MTLRHLSGARPLRRQNQADGFTLIELLVSLGIVVGLLVAVLTFFDFSSRLSRVQIHTSDMQQAVRVAQSELVRQVRMTGRGPVPLVRFPDVMIPDGVGVGVANNVAADTKLSGCDCALVLEGTDVLTLRGVFSSSIYQISPAGPDFQLSLPSTGTLILRNLSPTAVPQDLQPIKEAIESAIAGSSEALLLVSPVDDSLYAIVEIQDTSSVTPLTGVPVTATLNFKITGGTYSTDYLRLSTGGVYPPGLQTVAYAGLLEEYRYYVREDRATPGDASSELIPRLSLARFYPGTQIAYEGDTANLHLDMVDNVFDMQIALGIDTDLDEDVDEDEPPSATDEWLFNHENDDPTAIATWNGTVINPARLFYLRLNTLTRTARPDPKFQADILGIVEDKDYADSPFNTFNSVPARRFRRRMMRTVIDLRNLS